MSTQAKKLVIITEKLLFKHVARIIESAGGSGYTVTPAEGKGSRGGQSIGQHSVSDTFEKVRVEFITTDEAMARKIADEIANNYFDNFSGLIYLGSVEVLYAHSL
jgi:nitrogen regulatory protein PII